MGRREIARFIPPNNAVLISIIDPDARQPEVNGNWDNIISLAFWDATHEKHGQPLATREQCRQIWDFIQQYKEKHIFAHCEAGVSRSGAVREYLERNGWIVMNPNWQIFPNIHVLNWLNHFDREVTL